MKLPQSFYRAQAQSIQTQWIQTLRDLRDVSDQRSRSIYIDDMRNLHARASDLKDTQQLHPLDEAKLSHILSRPIEEHVILVKPVTDGTLIPTFRQP
jgi:hypothetical protein